MLAREVEGKPEGRRFSIEEQAKALVVILSEEFGEPFTFFNAQTGAEIRTADADAPGASRTLGPRLDLATIHQLATDGRARVTAMSGGRFQLALLLYEERKPVLVAAGEVAGQAKGTADARRELVMVEKWAQAVSDRMRLADQLAHGRRAQETPVLQNTTPWEALLALDHLTRRLRLHKDAAVNYKRIVETAFGFVGAQALLWVPANSEEPVLVHGDTCLATADCRLLAGQLAKSPDYRPPGPILYDRFQERPGATRFPQVMSLLAFPVTNQGLAGWVIALNKRGGSGPLALKGKTAGATIPPSAPSGTSFRKTDAALLTPFVALLELHAHGATRYQELKNLLVGLTRALTTAIDAKDTYTYGHSERVARIAVELGRDLGLDGDDLGDIYLAGLLHDVGKIGIRDEVLRKPGKLTPEEQDHIRQHVTIGYSILSDLRQIRNLLPGVLYHHERYDGGGYPDGLAGENIPLLARILAVADAYDAMTTARPYREPLPWRTVEDILAAGAGTQWDGRIVEAFQRCRQKIHTIRQRGVGESLRQAIEGALRMDPDSHHQGFAPVASVE
jgi:HD-GYP domain-containing protein (c-di-GMP phosphodiesterase class II)